MNAPTTITAAAAALLLTLSVPPARAQVVSTLDTLGAAGSGVVTTAETGAVREGDYAAEGILSEWSILLEEYEQYDGDREIDALAARTAALRVRMQDLRGRIVTLPSMPDENGIDLYLLTTEGITIYLGLDAPVYHQEPDEDVVKWIRYYAYDKRERTRRLFGRYADWEHRLKDYFRAVGVPAELTELCLIESGCTYTALSPAGALGMWQIMPGTGRQFGLRVNDSVDDRKDPVLSTQAAARILLSNYRRAGDWTLAAAAYNCGSGRIDKASDGGRRDWPATRARLPRETQQYIPALIAIHYVWTYRAKLGF